MKTQKGNQKILTQESKTTKGIKQCATWLSYCLSNGWKKEQLNALEKLWWAHHDDRGNLRIEKETQEKEMRCQK